MASPNAQLTTSLDGEKFVARFEGLRNRVYNDNPPNGNATIGVGHLLHYGPPTFKDRLVYWPNSKCYSVLHQDLFVAENAVRKLVTRPLGQGQFDALVSFTFNCGVVALASSNLLKLVNQELGSKGAGLITAAFLSWDHANGQVLPGLLRRRAAEARLYLQGVYE